MLKLLLYNYQQTARYYTIYRTFKQWSSDDFTTILRLFVGRNYDYWLRLFQNLLRLFQPERYDYCLPLLAIGRKPEKRCGDNRQWFRAARRADPVQVETLTLQQVRRAQHLPAIRTRWELTRRRWHGLRYAALPDMDPQQGAPLRLYIPYYNRRLC